MNYYRWDSSRHASRMSNFSLIEVYVLNMEKLTLKNFAMEFVLPTDRLMVICRRHVGGRSRRDGHQFLIVLPSEIHLMID